MTSILYRVAERVATLTLNRPAVMNAFDDGMREDLLARLRTAGDDPDVGCIVITGAGDAFCAGGDIGNMRALQDADDVAPIQARIRIANEVVELLRAISKPVIAAVNGAAAGGGMNLALACDIRYGSEHARFAESFVRIGLVPDWGGHYLLTRLVGLGRALEMMWLGERIDAAEAYRLGILNAVFPAAEFAANVAARAARFAAGPPAALAAIKRGTYLAEAQGLAAALAHEYETQSALFLSADAREGMQAFVDKRPPHFGARD